jgi:endonuclease/exonuclease/phosphatase family metal-dependent hydrolase
MFHAATVLSLLLVSCTLAAQGNGNLQSHFLHSYTAVGEPMAPPGPPEGLASTVSGHTAAFVWQPPSTGGVPASYVLEASLSPGGPLIASMPVVGTTLDVPNVPNGVYYVRVRALNASGVSAPSHEVVVVVPADGGCTGLPGAPESLRGSATNNQVTLSWRAPANDCGVISYSVQAGSTPGATDIAVVNVGNARAVSSSAPPGTYYVRVVAVNALGGSVASNEVAVSVPGGGCMAAPHPSQDLRARVTGSTVTLSWSPPADGCASTTYTVHAGSYPGQSDLGVVSVGAATSLTATASAGTYYVHVVASNALGTSAPSAPVSVIVTADATAPTPSPAPTPAPTPGPTPAPSPAPTPTPTPTPSGTSLPVVTWNIQINDSSEAHARLAMGLLVQMSPRTPEVVIVQEAHLPHVQVYLNELQKQTGRKWQGAFATQCAPGTWNGSSCSPWHQGVGIFTTYEILDSGSLLMPYPDCWTAARVAVRAAVNVNGRVVQVFGTHLQSNSCGDMSAQRRRSMAQFKTWAAQFSAPQIAGGDFNGETFEINTTSGMLPDFIDTWSVGTGGRVTAYGPTPTKKLDYLFVDDGGNAVPETSEVLYSTGSASDHYPVYAVIRVRQ